MNYATHIAHNTRNSGFEPAMKKVFSLKPQHAKILALATAATCWTLVFWLKHM